MCGIIGYVGKNIAQPILLKGLASLEYRGYDSCGMVSVVPKKAALSVRKLPAKVKELRALTDKKPLLGNLAMGHVRWATHGAPNQANAHPHLDCNGEIAVVHNGIIENYQELKKELIKEGHVFKSQTDTEVIPHFLEKYSKNSTLFEAVKKTVKHLKGSFAICVISSREPDKIIGARLGNPLVVGIGQGENFLASDVTAFLEYTKEAVFLNDNEIALITEADAKIFDFKGEELSLEPVNISWDPEQAQKGGFEHFMLKEINEQPLILRDIFKQRIKNKEIIFEELSLTRYFFKTIDNIIIVACGTAYHAGLGGKYLLESLTGLPVSVNFSSEFRYARQILTPSTLVIAISQSGETADTLAAVKQIRSQGIKVLAICNVLGSSLSRESDGVIYTHAGPEISVASTKAYTAQITILALFTLFISDIKDSLFPDRKDKLLDLLVDIPNLLEKILKHQQDIIKIAKRHSHFGSFLYLGRNINYPSALEGALKLKEISYIQAEGYAAGEMKHGPIALIDEYRAVVCIATQSFVYEKMISNIQEINARRAKIIAIGTEGDTALKNFTKEVIFIPKTEEIFSPLLVAVPLQLLAYSIAVKRGCHVDQPRNLAKSVTVE